MSRAIIRPVINSLDSIVEEWIGFAYPPVSNAISAAQWQPDAPNEYCHRCGDSVGIGEATASGCSTCRDGAELAGGIGDGVIRLGTYAGPLQAWISAIKYGKWLEMADHLGALLGEAVRSRGDLDPSRTLVVQVPMPWARRVYRGIDHSRVIAESVARSLGAPLVSILKRRHEPPQVSLPRHLRKRSGTRGLRLRRRWGGWPVRDSHLLLVDDVRTTGATLRAATRILGSIDPEKTLCAVIAVSDSKARRLRSGQDS